MESSDTSPEAKHLDTSGLGRMRNFPDTGQRRFASLDRIIGPEEAQKFRSQQVALSKAEREAEARAEVDDAFKYFRPR